MIFPSWLKTAAERLIIRYPFKVDKIMQTEIQVVVDHQLFSRQPM